MAHAVNAGSVGVVYPRDSTTTIQPTYQAYQILHFAFSLAPILAGLDKFLDLMVDWDKYLAPVINNILQGHGHQFMLTVGVIEIIAGIGVAWKPRYFGYVVAGWLFAIVVNLLLAQGFYDIALRDFGLGLGALALARLAAYYDR